MKLPIASFRAAAPLAVTLAAAGVLAAAGLTTQARQADAEVQKADQAQVKALYTEKCSACHNLPVPEEKGYTRTEWQRTVNTMLTKYQASDEISPNQAAQIVDYLATFAPKAPTGNGRLHGSDPWATDSLDVWPDLPSASHVFNFEAGGLGSFSALASGTPGQSPVWSVKPDKAGADGLVAQVVNPNFRPDRFALLLDRADTGRNIDVRVRFRIDSGKASPAAGITFGYASSTHYLILRCNQALGNLAVIQIAGPVHTTLQQTALEAAAAAPGWHTLRLLVRDRQVRGWLDRQKRISTALPDYSGGKIGLWTQGSTSASFDDWTIDCYDVPPAPIVQAVQSLVP